MSAAAGRMASKVGQAATRVAGKAAESGGSDKQQSVLQKGAKRGPELYVGRIYTPFIKLGRC